MTTVRRRNVVTDTLDNLYVQEGLPSHVTGARVLLVGEVLWDEFPDCARLGGAPLNVAVHLGRLRHAPLLVSAVGADPRGDETRSALTALGLDTTFVPTTAQYHTGRARVQLGPGDETSFTIERPAAYDALELSGETLQRIVAWNPTWLYYGTLFPSLPQPRRVLCQLLDRLPDAARFYDLNLRPGSESPELIDDLLRRADVVKLNEQELRVVQGRLSLPADPEGFCRAGAKRYGWRGACVTLGARGCAMLVGDDYVDAPGLQVHVADPVGAGDAFVAAFIHGLVSRWPVGRVATVANRMGALVAASHGAIPAAGCP